MKPLVIFLLFTISIPTFSQISFFKQLNDVEEGSYPSNFIEFKGEVYFTVRTIDGYRLWKTDGTEAGTVQVTGMNINTNNNTVSATKISNNQKLFVCNNYLYFRTFSTNPSFQNEIWKTDGANLTFVNFTNADIPQFCLNDTPIYEDYSVNNLKEIQIGDKIIKFNIEYFNMDGYPSYQVYKKTSNDNSENNLIGSISRMKELSTDGFLKSSLSARVGNEVYFITKNSIENTFNYAFQLWKTDGNTISFIKKIIEVPNSYFSYYNNPVLSITHLSNFNGKLLFVLKNDFDSYLWISDGTSNGTIQIDEINDVNTNNVNANHYNAYFGILSSKFCYAKTANYDTELWVSDGTLSGARLLKDLNTNGSSYPHNFVQVGDKVFFKTSQNQLWQSDGTAEGTEMIYNIPTPENLYTNQGYPQFIITTDNKTYFSNYNSQTGYELYRSNGIIGGIELVKNIATQKEPSVNPTYKSSTKLKIGNKWYFNGLDGLGTELWVTDGTHDGTKMVKDLNQGSGHTYITEMITTNNLLFFKVTINNNNHYFRSDGSENGTFEIPFEPQNYFYNTQLIASENRVFLMVNNNIWVSDGSISGTNKIISSSFFDYNNLQSIASIGEKCLIYNGRFYITDYTGNTQLLFQDGDINRPVDATCFLNFNNKLYFLGAKSSVGFNNYYGLFETDGTAFGTKVIKTFNNDPNFLNSQNLFLEKSSNKMYFRANMDLNSTNKSMELWTSDGTEQGTNFLKKIIIKSGSRLSFATVEDKFLLNVYEINISSFGQAYISDGTINNTFKLKDFISSGAINDIKKLNHKFYFTQYNFDSGTELWETDGTIAGTKLTAEIRPGQANSQINNLMNFDDKILMSGTDGINGTALWQYIDNTQIKSIKSGSWDDPTTWSSGVVPAITSNVTIDAGHTVTIPATIQANLYTIIIKTRGTLEIGNGSSLNLNGQN